MFQCYNLCYRVWVMSVIKYDLIYKMCVSIEYHA